MFKDIQMLENIEMFRDIMILENINMLQKYQYVGKY